MYNSEINACSVEKGSALEHEDIERELYISPFDILDENEIDSEILDGRIKQASDSFFDITISKNEIRQEEEDHSSEENNKDKKHPIRGAIHAVLDIGGFIPVLGAVPDLANGIIYCFEGDYTNMGLSLLAAIPAYGDTVAAVAKGAKYVSKGAKAIKSGKTAANATKTGSKIASATSKKFLSNEISDQAAYIVDYASKNDIKKISFFWTNGTKFNAKAVEREVLKIKPDLKINILETTMEGIQMEKLVNRKLVEEGLRQGYTKEELFKLLKKNELWNKVAENSPKQFKQSLQALQRRKSIQYAKSAKNDEWLIRFQEKGGKLGQGAAAEQEVLDKFRKSVDVFDINPDKILKRVMNPDGSTKLVPMKGNIQKYLEKAGFRSIILKLRPGQE